MDRIHATVVSSTAPAPPATSLPQGYPQDRVDGGQDGTIFAAWYLHMLIEEIRNVIVDAGLAPIFSSTGQLSQAISALIAAAGAAPVAVIADDRVSGVHGGGFTSGSWVARQAAEISDANNLVEITGGTAIALAAGTYEVDISCPAYYCGPHQARLYNVTGSAVAIVGTSEDTNPGQEAQVTRSVIRGRISHAVTTTYRIEHRCTTTRATDGLGVAAGFGTERYTVGVFRRIAT